MKYSKRRNSLLIFYKELVGDLKTEHHSFYPDEDIENNNDSRLVPINRYGV